MTLSTLTRRAQKYILILRSYSDAMDLYGTQSPVLVAIAREQEILWAGMDDDDRADYKRYLSTRFGR